MLELHFHEIHSTTVQTQSRMQAFFDISRGGVPNAMALDIDRGKLRGQTLALYVYIARTLIDAVRAVKRKLDTRAQFANGCGRCDRDKENKQFLPVVFRTPCTVWALDIGLQC